MQPLRQALDGLLLRLRRRIGRRHHGRRYLTGHLERLVDLRHIGGEPPQHAGGDHHKDQARHDGEIELEVESLHAPPKHFPAKACPGLDPGWEPVRRRKCVH